ncbi:MAG: hypothetical protein UH229_09450, partial [Lachnospiraceae bacterium]|nr:hypothetical protein [Lachnospiraceae bacterium]
PVFSSKASAQVRQDCRLFPLRNPVFSSKASAQVRRVCGLFRLRTPFLPLKKTGPFIVCTFMTDSLSKNCLFVKFFD